VKRSSGDLGVSRETVEKLQAYLALLIRWNARINLVADADPETLWHRHVVDSLQLLDLMPEASGPLVDLGSGAGFPGMVLATAGRFETYLVESDKRKAAFLMEVTRLLVLPNVTVCPLRIEAAVLPRAMVMTARALAPLPQLLRYANRILAPNGTALLPKGRTAEQELTAAAADWTMRVERFPSVTDPDSIILRLSEIHPVSAPA
jgi:16S rRNA (guanine(527)-N(7))-methyltransferase RsmG